MMAGIAAGNGIIFLPPDFVCLIDPVAA